MKRRAFLLLVRFLILTSFIVFTIKGKGQSPQHTRDSLYRELLKHPQKDTTRIDLLAWLSVENSTLNPAEGIHNLKEALDIASTIKSNRDYGLWVMLGWAYMHIDDYPRSIEAFQKMLQLTKPDTENYGAALAFIGMNYKAQGDLDKALYYALACKEIGDKIKAKGGKMEDPRDDIGTAWNLSEIYFKKNILDSALAYGHAGLEILKNKDSFVIGQFYPIVTNIIAKTYILLNQKDSAKKYSDASFNTKIIPYALQGIGSVDRYLTRAKWFLAFGAADSAVSIANYSYEGAKQILSYDLMVQSAEVIRKAYEKNKNFKQALYYNDIAWAVKDSMLGLDKIKKTQAMHYDMQLKEQQVTDLKKEFGLKSRIRLLTAGGLFSLVFIGLLFMNVQHRKKTIITLNDQNTIIESQKDKLEQSIKELHEKQTQLIQTEKMASLGELTAGIAHEIQNPLNFVNNFSEINKELIFELKHEITKVKQDTDEESLSLLSNLESNTSKIYLHGKRAEAIVRSMLEHSRNNPGEKTETDINALAEEYLKLSHYAIRARHNNFNATLITELDPSIHTLRVISADIGRVLINLFNNAFYSMIEKQKKSIDYQPTLIVKSVSTGKITEIIIRDNGMGIPEAIQSKIFQPFFTTKPTGNGTGLGLSLSYDIITKAHGGTISVDSVEGAYCTFTIGLPSK